jgi:hypothetical protein
MDKASTERKRKHMEKMRARHLKLVQVWVPESRTLEIKSIAVCMVEEGDKDLKPSQRQLEFAQFLCDKKGLKIPQEMLLSSKKLSEWLNKNKKKLDKI